jgi:trehalose 6-phosphate phosphatase
VSLGDLETFALAPGDALFLDFDGVLTELGPDPDAIRLEAAAAAAIEALAAGLGGAVALLSGRDLRDLAGRTPRGVWRAGGHGLEVAAPHAVLPDPPPPPADAVLAPLRALAARLDGVRIEIKGPVAAAHYRAAPAAGDAVLDAAHEAAGAGEGLVVQAGKMVVEVKPDTAHKGTALRRFATRAPFAGRRPVMLGDDTTDEDAMAAAQALGGVGVKVGEGETVARLRTPDPAAVRAWLAREAGRLGRAT